MKPSWMPDNPFEEYTMEEQSMQLQCEGFTLGCKETARKIAKWGEGICNKHWDRTGTGRRPLRRFDCPECMQQFCKKVEL